MAEFNAEQAHEQVMGLLTDIKKETSATNGRLRSVEQKVAVLSWAYGVAGAVWAYMWSRVSSNGG